jgi:ribose transport system permease protein
VIGTRVVALRSRLTGLRGTRLLRTANLLGLLAVTVAFWIFFSLVAIGFTSDFNLFFLLRSAAIAVTIGFAQMVVLSIGDMNLSVGAIGGAVGMCAGWLMQSLGLPPVIAVPIAIGLGAALGLGNAGFVVWTHLNSFIVTLATASLITGAMLVITRAKPFSNLPDSFIGFAQLEVGGLPISPIVLLMLAVAVVLGGLYRGTSIGREMLAVGANRQAARMSGLAVARIVFVAHGLSGALAAIAGVMSIAANNTASPAVGSDWVLSSFVAPAIGGTLLSGGLVSVSGTVIGGLLVATISSGLLLMSISNFWLNVFLGAVLLLAVGLDRVTRTVGGAA